MAKKQALGKGLNALLGESAAEVGKEKNTSMLAITEIVPNKSQPRKTFDDDAMDELIDSIKQNGILQPILVRKINKGYEIVAGERRYQAAKKAGLKEVPVMIKVINDEDVFKLALIENLQRSDLNAIEEAQGYKELIDKHKLTQDALAKILSKSRPAIANALRLLDLPEQIQELMIERKITSGHARAILAVPTDEARIKLADKVVKENLSVRQTETLAPLFSGLSADSTTKRQPSPQSYKRAARLLRESLDTNVRVKSVRGKNKIEIEFSDEDDLKRLVRIISSEEE